MVHGIGHRHPALDRAGVDLDQPRGLRRGGAAQRASRWPSVHAHVLEAICQSGSLGLGCSWKSSCGRWGRRSRLGPQGHLGRRRCKWCARTEGQGATRVRKFARRPALSCRAGVPPHTPICVGGSCAPPRCPPPNPVIVTPTCTRTHTCSHAHTTRRFGQGDSSTPSPSHQVHRYPVRGRCGHAERQPFTDRRCSFNHPSNTAVSVPFFQPYVPLSASSTQPCFSHACSL